MVFISYLQVNKPELHDDIEPLDIPGVELEEAEVRHKDNFETVGLVFLCSYYQWRKECYHPFGRLDRQKLKGEYRTFACMRAHLGTIFKLQHEYIATG